MEPTVTVIPSFDGLRVLAFESRRATELASLVSTFGGRPVIAPALKEVPIESNDEARAFLDRLVDHGFDGVVFLTGVGTRALADLAARTHSKAAFVAALSRAKVVARGPKPVAVLRELQVPIWLTAPEPNTWHELLAALDDRTGEWPLAGARIAVQEYGVSNADFLEGLRGRGAQVTRVPVYRWALPDDPAPLRAAVTAVSRGEVDVALFTTGVQVVHLWQIVDEMRLAGEVRGGLSRAVVASIGPTTTGELRRYGVEPDLEASHPKMGLLVREAADRAGGLLQRKRERTPERG
jgi:uroporphyrinogen-III synthase